MRKLTLNLAPGAIVVAAALVWVCGLTAQDGPAAADLAVFGDSYWLSGDFDQAIEYYEAALTEDAAEPRAWEGLTRTLEARDEPLAFNFLTRNDTNATEQLPSLSRATLASLYFRRGAVERAIVLAGEAHDDAGRSALVRGGVAAQQGDYATAVLHFKEARAAGSYVATYFLCEVLIRTRNYDQANLYLDEVVCDYPYFVEGRCARGELYYYMGDADAAGREFETALRYDPRCRRALFDLAVLASQRGDWGEAIRLYNRVLDEDASDRETLRRVAAAYEHIDEAIARAKWDEYNRRFGPRR